MTARSASYSSSGDGGGVLGFIILLAVAVTAGLILGAHAGRHSMADIVRNCPQDNIAIKLVNPLTGRIAIICEYEPDQFGRVIIEDDNHEVTSYASAKRRVLNDLEHVIENMHRGGYNVVRYVKPEFVNRISEILIRILVP